MFKGRTTRTTLLGTNQVRLPQHRSVQLLEQKAVEYNKHFRKKNIFHKNNKTIALLRLGRAKI